jgi:hypothetical protein
LIEAAKKVLASPEKRWAILITLVISLVVITPLCGLLFQCGCDWPWLGLDANCNYYKAHKTHQCPWCVSIVAGVLSTGLAIMGGLFAVITPAEFSTSLFKKQEVLVRVLLGVSVFFLIAILTASVVAMWQKYPLGIGSFLR